MKRTLLAIFLIAACTALFAAQPATGVTGTFHDLSTTGYHAMTNMTQVCIFCHTPHDAIGSVGGGNINDQLIPLWNHTTSTSTFTMYNSTNNPISMLQGTVDASPSGTSLACLSCHDGTLAVGAIANVPYSWPSPITYGASTSKWVDHTTGIIQTGTPVYVGTDLTNDHPISITYRDDLDTGLKAAAGLTNVQLFPTNATGSKVQCGSCHDPHNYGVNANNAPFLRDTMVGSAMCLKCHNK